MVKLKSSDLITLYASDAKETKTLQTVLRLSNWDVTELHQEEGTQNSVSERETSMIYLLSYNQVWICCNESLHNAFN